MKRGRVWLLPCLVLMVAIALRAAVLSISLNHVSLADTANYFAMVEHLSAGRGLVFDDPALGEMRAQFPPLFPLLLWLFSLVGGINTLTIAVFNSICDLGTALALIWLGRIIGLERPGLLAAAAYLLWPANIILAPLAQKESLVTLLAVLVACALLASVRSSRIAAAFGAFSGLLALTQPGLAPLPVVLSIFLFKQFAPSAWLRTMTVAVVVAAVVMLPWWIRNWLIFRQFIPLTSMAGLALWVGAVPWGNGAGTATAAHLVVGNEIAINRAAGAEAWQWIAQAPVDYLLHCAAKIGRAFSEDATPEYVLNFRTPELWFVSILTRPLGLILLLGSVASVVLKRPPFIGRIIIACFAQILIFQFWFEFAERHRYFLTPFLMMAVMSNRAPWPKLGSMSGSGAHPPSLSTAL